MTAMRADARENHERMLEAAREVFAERGMLAEIKEIADRAGVGVGTIYRHFANKDVLLEAILGDVVERFRDATDRALAEPDPVTAVRSYVNETFAISERWGGVVRCMMSETLPPGGASQFSALISDKRMGIVFARGIASGVFRRDLDPVVAAAVLFADAHPIVYLMTEGECEPATVRDGMAEIFLRGIMS